MDKIKQVQAQLDLALEGLNSLLKGNEKSLLAEIHENMECVLSKFELWKETDTTQPITSIPKRSSIQEELTDNLWEAIDFGKILSLNQKLYITSFREEDDGDFPTEKDWKEFCEKVDNRGTYFLSEYLSDGVTVFDENQKIRVMFQTPIRVVTGFEMVNNSKVHVISEVTGIVISLDYEWYHINRKKMATMCEVTGQIIGLKQ
jgi:hypothetical protein